MRYKTNQLVSLVDVSKHVDLKKAITHALELINFDFNKKLGKVAIKPNLCYYWKSSTGETTDPKIIEAIIDVFRINNSSDEIYVVESDATVMKTKHAFRILDYEQLALRKGVKLINLCEETSLPVSEDVNVPFPNKIKIPELLTKVDLFISVPKLKIHSLTGLSCALKNQFGCIPFRRKVIFHGNLSKVIAYINKLVTPGLVLVDGTISRGKTPKRLNLVMAGYDPVATDFVAAKIAGLDPKRIEHIVESENLGVGSTNVNCVGESWMRFSVEFPKKKLISGMSRKGLMKLYYMYLRLFTLDGKIFRTSSAMESW